MRIPSLLIAFTLAFIALPQPKANGADPPSPGSVQTEIQSWIDGLQSDQFAVREWATQKLIDAGSPVIDVLADSIENVNVESMERGLSILHALALAESKTARHAENALQRLAANRATTSAQRADDVLRSLIASRTDRAEKILRRLGAEFDQVISASSYYTYSPSVKTVTIGDTWTGTAQDLVYLSWLTGYQKIAVIAQGKNFTDQHLSQVAMATNLVGLNLSRASVTDDGMIAVQDMPLLQDLRIYYCNVSDKCLRYLDNDMSELRAFSVFGTSITEKAFDELVGRRTDKRMEITGRYGKGGFLGIAGKADPNGKGCIVTSVTPNEAANKAGILPDDIITEYNGQAVTEFIPTEQMMKGIAPVIPTPDNGNEKKEPKPALSELIGQNMPGDRVKVSVLRRKKYINIEVELGEWP